jgi:hypothetical protein
VPAVSTDCRDSPGAVRHIGRTRAGPPPPPGELSDSDYKRADEVCGLLAEKGTELGGPWSDHLEGSVRELRLRLRDVAARVIVLLTVFRKTRQHEQRQIDRAVRAQKTCERDHHGPATQTYERQV